MTGGNSIFHPIKLTNYDNLRKSEVHGKVPEACRIKHRKNVHFRDSRITSQAAEVRASCNVEECAYEQPSRPSRPSLSTADTSQEARGAHHDTSAACKILQSAIRENNHGRPSARSSPLTGAASPSARLGTPTKIGGILYMPSNTNNCWNIGRAVVGQAWLGS